MASWIFRRPFFNYPRRRRFTPTVVGPIVLTGTAAAIAVVATVTSTAIVAATPVASLIKQRQTIQRSAYPDHRAPRWVRNPRKASVYGVPPAIVLTGTAATISVDASANSTAIVASTPIGALIDQRRHILRTVHADHRAPPWQRDPRKIYIPPVQAPIVLTGTASSIAVSASATSTTIVASTPIAALIKQREDIQRASHPDHRAPRWQRDPRRTAPPPVQPPILLTGTSASIAVDAPTTSTAIVATTPIASLIEKRRRVVRTTHSDHRLPPWTRDPRKLLIQNVQAPLILTGDAASIAVSASATSTTIVAATPVPALIDHRRQVLRAAHPDHRAPRWQRDPRKAPVYSLPPEIVITGTAAFVKLQATNFAAHFFAANPTWADIKIRRLAQRAAYPDLRAPRWQRDPTKPPPGTVQAPLFLTGTSASIAVEAPTTSTVLRVSTPVPALLRHRQDAERAARPEYRAPRWQRDPRKLIFGAVSPIVLTGTPASIQVGASATSTTIVATTPVPAFIEQKRQVTRAAYPDHRAPRWYRDPTKPPPPAIPPAIVVTGTAASVVLDAPTTSTTSLDPVIEISGTAASISVSAQAGVVHLPSPKLRSDSDLLQTIRSESKVTQTIRSGSKVC